MTANNALQRSIVYVALTKPKEESIRGSGFVIAKQGSEHAWQVLIATARHNLQMPNAKELYLRRTLSLGFFGSTSPIEFERAWDALLIASNNCDDWALLKIEISKIVFDEVEALPLRLVEQRKVRKWTVCGFPGGAHGMPSCFSGEAGFQLETRRYGTGGPQKLRWQLSACEFSDPNRSAAGYSGSPVLDREGYVFGMILTQPMVVKWDKERGDWVREGSVSSAIHALPIELMTGQIDDIPQKEWSERVGVLPKPFSLKHNERLFSAMGDRLRICVEGAEMKAEFCKSWQKFRWRPISEDKPGGETLKVDILVALDPTQGTKDFITHCDEKYADGVHVSVASLQDSHSPLVLLGDGFQLEFGTKKHLSDWKNKVPSNRLRILLCQKDETITPKSLFRAGVKLVLRRSDEPNPSCIYNEQVRKCRNYHTEGYFLVVVPPEHTLEFVFQRPDALFKDRPPSTKITVYEYHRFRDEEGTYEMVPVSREPSFTFLIDPEMYRRIRHVQPTLGERNPEEAAHHFVSQDSDAVTVLREDSSVLLGGIMHLLKILDWPAGSWWDDLMMEHIKQNEHNLLVCSDGLGPASWLHPRFHSYLAKQFARAPLGGGLKIVRILRWDDEELEAAENMGVLEMIKKLNGLFKTEVYVCSKIDTPDLDDLYPKEKENEPRSRHDWLYSTKVDPAEGDDVGGDERVPELYGFSFSVRGECRPLHIDHKEYVWRVYRAMKARKIECTTIAEFLEREKPSPK